MIALSMILADSDGALIINEFPTSKFKNSPARVTRTANLDGTATINHGGVQDSDRTLQVFGSLTETESDIIWYIHKNSTLLTICISDGAYLGAIDFLNIDGGNLNMSILIKEKVSA